MMSDGSDRAAETYRTLQSTIKYATGTRIRSVVVVDVDRTPSSGVAGNLCAAFIRAGDDCLFVDADMRNGQTEGRGLADLLRDPASAVEPVEEGDGVLALRPGSDPRPELLSSSNLAVVLERVLESHEFVIVSCPPLPEYGDAIAIAPHVDAAILVISAGTTGRQEAIRARDALERIGTRILGIVMVEHPRRWF